MTVIQNALVAINELLEMCPSCGSAEIDNAKASKSSGHTKITCKDCDHEWTESEFIMDKEGVLNLLLNHGLHDEADLIREMTEVAYRDFIVSNFDLSPYLH